MVVNEEYILVSNLGQEGLGDLTVSVKAPSSLIFEELELEASAIQEAMNGFYNITIPRENTVEAGTYVFVISGYELNVIEWRECLPKPLSSVPSPELCIINGNIRNLAGQAEVFENVLVTIRPLKLPLVVSGNLTLGKSIKTYTDFDGFFSLPAIRNARVLIEVKDAGIRFEADVPNQDTERIENLIP